MPPIRDLLPGFKFEKILNSDPQTKSIVLLGKIDEQDAIVSLEKSHFQFNDLQLNSLFESDNGVIGQRIRDININDVYHWGMCVVDQDLETAPSAKINVIYPATETHLKKYAAQQYHLIKETSEAYQRIVKPYIKTMKGDRIQWVRNILFNNYEADKILLRNSDPKTGFVVLPDMKWDGDTLDSLYCVCIVNREDISSVRDLNHSHVSWLKELNGSLRRTISGRYSIPRTQLRLFVHYQPSYYHFHIHIVNIRHPGLGDGIAAGKAILLEDIIENLGSAKSEGYASKTLYYVLGENHNLWNLGLKDHTV
ncbi:BA75_00287T0 [Komagataella pastoris]|uniref:BA75_00287T0 n=1 Tax=Komagataella pastoris TaxID=4922 RepID=A0A1B2J556_PICPA|nr:BA75_00287T0 [Komagataella pastoris]